MAVQAVLKVPARDVGVVKKMAAEGLSCIVLAAGRSLRMGRDNKLLLKYQGKEIIKRALDKFLSLDLAEIVVVTGYQSEQVSEVLKEYPVTITFNEDFLQGQSTSLKTGINSLTKNPLGAFFALGDQPLIKKKLLLC